MGGKKRSSFAFVFGQNAPPPLESLDRYTHEVWTGVDKKRGADVGADNLHCAARIVFGAEPSNEEILRFVVNKWAKLSFFGHDPTEASEPAKNPKRRGREAAKALKQPAMSTKAQQALAAQREAMKQESAHARSRRRAEEADALFEQRKLKRKQKHRGH